MKMVDTLEAVNPAHWIDNHNGTISCIHCHTWFYKDDRYSHMRYCPYCNVEQEQKEMIETYCQHDEKAVSDFSEEMRMVNKEWNEWINNTINKIVRQQLDNKERALAEIITKYDFIVGSMECKYKLMEILPEGANIVCSQYIENPTIVYVIKKFDVMDLLKEPPQIEEVKE